MAVRMRIYLAEQPVNIIILVSLRIIKRLSICALHKTATVCSWQGFSKKLNIHKFKCNGKALEADGLNLRFRKLLETTPAEKAYMDKIKNGTLEKISIEQAKADGLNLTGSTKQVARYKLLDDNYNKTNLEGFDIGGINLLLVYSDVDGKNLVAIGFVELVAVQMESVSDTKGSMTLNFYFQKD